MLEIQTYISAKMKTKITLFVVVCAMGAFSTITYEFVVSNYPNTPLQNYRNGPTCETIHVGIICLKRINVMDLYTMVKAMVFYRDSPLHFHLLVDKDTETIVKTLFDTWTITQVSAHVYNISKLPKSFHWVLDDTNLRKLAFSLMVSDNVPSLLVMDVGLFCVGDVDTLWQMQYWDSSQVQILFNEKWAATILLLKIHNSSEIYKTALEGVSIRNAKNVNLGTLHLQVDNISISSDQIRCNSLSEIQKINEFTETRNAIVKFNLRLLPESGSCPAIEQERIMPTNSVKECREVPEANVRNFKYCTLLYVRDFVHRVTRDDVTMVTHLVFEQVQVLEVLCRRWKGPVSIALYLKEDELTPTLNAISQSKTLKNRRNIAYHVLLKDGRYYPANRLRNIALQHVVTPYVFLNDIVLIPTDDLYSAIKSQIRNLGNLRQKALVIPAFALAADNVTMPAKPNQAKQMWEENQILPFHQLDFPKKHGPTNYTLLRTASEPYTVQWQPSYEPYIVVEKSVVKYDERFISQSWNRIEHSLELNAAKYEFIVLPNTFLVNTTNDNYQNDHELNDADLCMTATKKAFLQEIKKKYGRSYDLKAF